MLPGKKASDWYSLALVKIQKQDCVWQKIGTSGLSTKFSAFRYHWLLDYSVFENTFHMSSHIDILHCSFKFHGTIKSAKEDKRKEKNHRRVLLFQVNLPLTQDSQSEKGTRKDTYNQSCSSVWPKSVIFHTEMDFQHSHHQFLHFNWRTGVDSWIGLTLNLLRRPFSGWCWPALSLEMGNPIGNHTDSEKSHKKIYQYLKIYYKGNTQFF